MVASDHLDRTAEGSPPGMDDCGNREVTPPVSHRPVRASVVIPARNSEGTIARVITACLEQDLGAERFEVVVVDDGSSDDTWRILKEYASRGEILALRQPNLGAAAARNAGTRASSGEILVFCDADIIVPPNWLRRLVDAASGPEVGLVGCVYAPAEALPLITSCTHEEIRRRQIRGPDAPLHIGSFTMALRRSLFESVGGFDVEFIRAQDTELSYRVAETGYRSCLLKDLGVRHEHTRTLREWLVNQHKQAFWRARTVNRHPSCARGDGYACWRDWTSLAVSAAMLLTAPLALFGQLCIVPVTMIGLLAALQIPQTAFAIRDTGEWRHLAMIPMQMLRSVAWLAGGIASLIAPRRHEAQVLEAETATEPRSII